MRGIRRGANCRRNNMHIHLTAVYRVVAQLPHASCAKLHSRATPTRARAIAGIQRVVQSMPSWYINICIGDSVLSPRQWYIVKLNA